MRSASLLAVALLLAACASSGGTDAGSAAGDALSADLFPFDPAVATFTDPRGAAPRTLRVDPAGSDAALVVIEVDGRPPREMHATRRGGSVFLSDGVGEGTELVRAGARPGTSWTSNGTSMHFDGWERVETPAGAFEAARVSTSAGPDTLPIVETWWFARGTGLVRLQQDKGHLFTSEMVRASR